MLYGKMKRGEHEKENEARFPSARATCQQPCRSFTQTLPLGLDFTPLDPFARGQTESRIHPIAKMKSIFRNDMHLWHCSS